MNAYVIIFALVLAAAQAMPQGWSAPPPAPINIDLLMESESLAFGEAAAESTQATGIAAVGSALNPANIDSLTGTSAIVDQYHDHVQYGFIDTSAPSSASINLSSVGNEAEALDFAFINVEGTDVSVNNAAADSAAGSGAIYDHAQTSNVISSKKH